MTERSATLRLVLNHIADRAVGHCEDASNLAFGAVIAGVFFDPVADLELAHRPILPRTLRPENAL